MDDNQPSFIETIRDTASFLNLRDDTVRRLIASGKLPAMRVGGSIRVDPEALVAALRENPVVTRVEE
jgi:excisionase family DNA binding protein